MRDAAAGDGRDTTRADPVVTLFHFSEDPSIIRFDPRPVRIASPRPPGMEWLNGPLVWAIDEAHAFLYLFPRDCPRILVWAVQTTIETDRRRVLGDRRAVAYVESRWMAPIAAATIHRYALPADDFEDLGDAGMWVARQSVLPSARDAVTGLDRVLALEGVEIRAVDSLVPLRKLWQTSLHVSGIRLRNAAGWT